MENTIVYQTQSKIGWNLLPSHKSHQWGPSETVPDDCLTIKQIMQKFVHGQPIDENRKSEQIYLGGDFDSPDLESLKRMDLAERSEYVAVLKEQIAEKKQHLKDAMAAAAAQKLQETESEKNGSEPTRSEAKSAKRKEPKGGSPGADKALQRTPAEASEGTD